MVARAEYVVTITDDEIETIALELCVVFTARQAIAIITDEDPQTAADASHLALADALRMILRRKAARDDDA